MSFVRTIILLFLLAFVISTRADSVHTESQQKRFVGELENFVRVFGTIQQGYVDELTHRELFTKAIKGMMTQLDPHSSYLEPKEQEDLLENSSGKFGGLGIVISMEDGLVKIISPIDDTPAYRAGLQAGDFIIKIDDTSVRGISLDEAIDLMRGEPRTPVTITVLRKDIDPFEVKIIRDIITIISIKGHLLRKNIAYIRVSNFQAPTADLLAEKIDELRVQNKKDLKGLILDLRNNPGGLLKSAVEVSDLFLDDKGLIVYTKGRLANANIEYLTTKGDILANIPVVTLINKGTASAAEIVSGALQDHKRAVILGEKSFGKGSVQTVSSLSNGYGLKLTTARYYTPSGRSIQAEGIKPDVVLKDLAFKEENGIKFSESEKQLKRHIKQKEPKEEAKAPATSTKTSSADATDTILTEQERQKKEQDQKEIERLNNDYFVNQAVNALYVMQIWQ